MNEILKSFPPIRLPGEKVDKVQAKLKLSKLKSFPWIRLPCAKIVQRQVNLKLSEILFIDLFTIVKGIYTITIQTLLMKSYPMTYLFITGRSNLIRFS